MTAFLSARYERKRLVANPDQHTDLQDENMILVGKMTVSIGSWCRSVPTPCVCQSDKLLLGRNMLGYWCFSKAGKVRLVWENAHMIFLKRLSDWCRGLGRLVQATAGDWCICSIRVTGKPAGPERCLLEGIWQKWERTDVCWSFQGKRQTASWALESPGVSAVQHAAVWICLSLYLYTID